jgi:hypothetical protein
VGAWGLSYEFSAEPRRAEYLAVFSLGVSAQEVAGPWLVTMAVAFGFGGWSALAGLLLVAAVLVKPVVGWLVSGQLAVEHGGGHGVLDDAKPVNAENC